MPMVKQERLTEREAYMEFMGQFNTQEREGKVSEDEFVLIIKLLSGSISDDAEFAEVVRGSFQQ